VSLHKRSFSGINFTYMKMAYSRFIKKTYKHIALLSALCLFLHWSLAQQPDPRTAFPKPPSSSLQSPEEILRNKPADPDAAFMGQQHVLTAAPVPHVNKNSKSVIFLENAETMSYDTAMSPDVEVLRGSVKFRQDHTYMYCDSAYFYEKANSLDAFGNVKMVQGDTLYIYGDILYYDGNTKKARLRYNVRMENRKVVLTTDTLLFDRMENVGYYDTGGRIVDETNVLTSLIGQYYPSTKTAIFKTTVKLINPNFVLRSDTLRYNTGTDITTIVGPSTIIHKNKTTITSNNR
jgi:lipopolysaccharide assembly outer membrane protein LptD (OstA)